MTVHGIKNGRRFRGLVPVGKDQDFLLALADPAFMVSGLTNKMLRKQLEDTDFAKGHTTKELSAKISRHLLLLRRHGIIRKYTSNAEPISGDHQGKTFSPHISQVEAAADALSVEAGYSGLYLLRKRQSR